MFHHTFHFLRQNIRIVAGAILVIVLIVALSTYFFRHSRAMMEMQIREKLKTIAAIAASEFSGEEIDGVRDLTNLEDPALHELAERLQLLRASAPQIRFIYILRRTAGPNTLQFVADADMFASKGDLDLNGNGILEASEDPFGPGDLYSIREAPVLAAAFDGPSVDESAAIDPWRRQISGYAPIRNDDGKAVALLGVDMDAGEFFTLTGSIFSPVALILSIMGGVMLVAMFIVSAGRKQIILLQKINAERSGLLQLTFHQLGEPLTIMKWSVETIREETDKLPTRAKLDEHFACMDEGLTRLDAIIEVLQQAEKVDLGSMEYHPENASLKKIVTDIVHSRRHTFADRKGKVHIDIKDDLIFTFDTGLIGMVIGTLLDNAADYSSDESPITISAKKSHNKVTVSVEDKGHGIPAKDLKRIGEKYARGSNAHLYRPDGNGLGIYTSKGIVERAGGKMNIESVQGKGTIVTFTLPIS